MYRLSPPERLGELYGLCGQVGIMTLLVTMLIGLVLVRGVPEKREG